MANIALVAALVIATVFTSVAILLIAFYRVQLQRFSLELCPLCDGDVYFVHGDPHCLYHGEIDDWVIEAARERDRKERAKYG